MVSGVVGRSKRWGRHWGRDKLILQLWLLGNLSSPGACDNICVVVFTQARLAGDLQLSCVWTVRCVGCGWDLQSPMVGNICQLVPYSETGKWSPNLHRHIYSVHKIPSTWHAVSCLVCWPYHSLYCTIPYPFLVAHSGGEGLRWGGLSISQ